MNLRTVTIACGLALAGAAVSGCVETGPHHGGFYGPGPVVHHERDRHDRDARHDRFDRDHRSDRRRDDHRSSRDRHDRRDYGDRSHRVDCRHDPRNPACYGHH